MIPPTCCCPCRTQGCTSSDIQINNSYQWFYIFISSKDWLVCFLIKLYCPNQSLNNLKTTPYFSTCTSYNTFPDFSGWKVIKNKYLEVLEILNDCRVSHTVHACISAQLLNILKCLTFLMWNFFLCYCNLNLCYNKMLLQQNTKYLYKFDTNSTLNLKLWIEMT